MSETNPIFRSGLVSITFRQLSVREIVDLVRQAGQAGIEWGGDLHVPPGDPSKAEEVRRMTEEAGLEVAAYGSYYRCGSQEPDEPPFEKVLQTAVQLKAPSIRVWAGRKSPAQHTEAEFAEVREDFERICRMARRENIEVATEFHRNTLTETRESTRALFQGISPEEAKSLWQPHVGQSVEDRLDSMDDVADRLLNIHVFQWGPGGGGDRRPLEEGREEWTKYFEKISRDGRPRWALMEFVDQNDPENYLRDGAILNEMIRPFSSSGGASARG